MLDSGADGNMVFEPGYLEVTPGDTVHFVPAGTAHNSTSNFSISISAIRTCRWAWSA